MKGGFNQSGNYWNGEGKGVDWGAANIGGGYGGTWDGNAATMAGTSKGNEYGKGGKYGPGWGDNGMSGFGKGGWAPSGTSTKCSSPFKGNGSISGVRWIKMGIR